MRRELVVLEDDLDGGRADETVRYALDGVNYEIDLSEKNASKLRTALQDYLAASRRLGRVGIAPRRTHSVNPSAAHRAIAQSNRDQNRAVREWALKMGYEVADRGRVPERYTEEYQKCGGLVTKEPTPPPKDTPPTKTVPAQVTGAANGAKKTTGKSRAKR
jgi:hypothetical protein